VPTAYLGLGPADIAARVRAVAAAAAAAEVQVHVGDDVFGCRNLGVVLPPGRRSAAATRLLRLRVRDALEKAGVVLAESALAPRVAGDLRGSVRVREVTATYLDAAHVQRAPADGGGKTVRDFDRRRG
jgi:hypothetical protein